MNLTIQQYFDKSRFLKIKNKMYANACLELFDFQIKNDLVENDITIKLIQRKYENVKAIIVAREPGVVAGIEETVYLVEKNTDLKIKIFSKDKTVIKKNDRLMELYGNPLEILKFERTVLNIISRMSGIATHTHSLIKENNLKTPLAATRKTLWGLMDKKAVAVGGGLTHRLSLSDEILIKDNHIDIVAKNSHINRLESLLKILIFIKNSRIKNPFEIEVETELEAFFLYNAYEKISITAPLIIMLDNFTSSAANRIIKAINNPLIFFELSGGINKNNIIKYDKIGANIISLGALTHSPKALDLSLKFM